MAEEGMDEGVGTTWFVQTVRRLETQVDPLLPSLLGNFRLSATSTRLRHARCRSRVLVSTSLLSAHNSKQHHHSLRIHKHLIMVITYHQLHCDILPSRGMLLAASHDQRQRIKCDHGFSAEEST